MPPKDKILRVSILSRLAHKLKGKIPSKEYKKVLLVHTALFHKCWNGKFHPTPPKNEGFYIAIGTKVPLFQHFPYHKLHKLQHLKAIYQTMYAEVLSSFQSCCLPLRCRHLPLVFLFRRLLLHLFSRPLSSPHPPPLV